jgi:hypothetical protein
VGDWLLLLLLLLLSLPSHTSVCCVKGSRRRRRTEPWSVEILLLSVATVLLLPQTWAPAAAGVACSAGCSLRWGMVNCPDGRLLLLLMLLLLRACPLHVE